MAALLLIAGYVAVRRRRVDLHRVCMVAALVCSTAFLVSYLIYHHRVGSVRFEGVGPVRTFYLSMLASHTVLAAAVPFLAIVTVARAWRGDIARHRRIARWTLPIWLYVSATGVAVYWMLYRMSW